MNVVSLFSQEVKRVERKFIISCCSTVDMPYSYMESRHIPVLFYTYTMDGREYEDDMDRDPRALPHFYEMLSQGKLPSTSQINVARYMDFFEEQLQKGDLLHIAFTSGQSGSVNNAFLAARELQERYPDRKVIVVDSLCSSSGYGMLVDYVADMADQGATIEECEAWLMANRNRIHHQFFSCDMSQFRRTGRVSGTAAAVATVLNICPVMRLDAAGAIKAYDKVRGKKKALEETVKEMMLHAENGTAYQGKCHICHSQCSEEAQLLKEAIEAQFPRLQGKIRIFDIGTIIGSHSGIGTVALFFLGDERPVMD